MFPILPINGSCCRAACVTSDAVVPTVIGPDDSGTTNISVDTADLPEGLNEVTVAFNPPPWASTYEYTVLAPTTAIGDPAPPYIGGFNVISENATTVRGSFSAAIPSTGYKLRRVATRS
jgi:hypothetical protein